MWIEYIKLKNYRQYRDVVIEFGKPEGDRNFIIVQGSNGAGKTNVLNAITWCLYGKEKHIESKYAGLPIYNMLTAKETEEGDFINVEVEIQFRTIDNKRIKFKRDLRFKKVDNDKLLKVPHTMSNSPDGSLLEMMREINRDMIPVEDPSYVIRYLIPESIEEYFFFDGEKLDEYFKEASGIKIKEAVFKISQVELLERIIDHLEKRKSDFIKKIKDLKPSTIKLIEEKEFYEKNLRAYKEELEQLKNDKKEAEKKENEYNEKLKTCSLPKIKALQEERLQIEKDLEALEKDIEEIEKEKESYLFKISPLIFLYEPLLKAHKLISSAEEAGDIPPDYKRNFLEKLLEKGRCICGADISKNNEYRRRIEKLLKQCDQITDISENLIKLNVEMRSVISEIKNFEEVYERYNKKLREYKERRKNKSKRLKFISEEINKVDVEQINFWEEKLQEYKQVKEKLIERISEGKVRCEEAEKYIRKIEKDLRKEMEKEERFKETQELVDFCDKSLEEAKKIKDRIMENVRKEIEEKTKKQFFELIWKKREYKDVKIDKDYNISVLHQSGIEGIGTMSAGERQALALSFMAALNSVSGFDVPIIIDTPLGRLSKKPKNNIARNLPNYLRGKQVTLLVTDEEYTPEVREKILDRLCKEYRIEFRESLKGNEAKVVSYE